VCLFVSLDDIDKSRCIVQYWFESGNEHKVAIKPHGNRKHKRQPFCRTHPSAMTLIKEESENSTPKDVVSVIYKKQGGLMGASSVGELPRDRHQISNIRSKTTNTSICSAKGLKDPLYMVMEQSKLCECEEKFVRVVNACPEPMCVLATDQQLNDLVRFSTNPNQFCVLSIDPTFSLGDFNVTCITYRHLLVTDGRTGQSPVMLGPLFVHQSKSFSAYQFFASSLLGIQPKLIGILSFGTDGEDALVKAFKQQLQFAVHLRCFRHMRQDIKRKLATDMGFPDNIVSEILADIFGNKDGPTFFEGLVDSNSENEFDSNLEVLEERWERFEHSRSKVPASDVNFFTWLKRYHAEEIKSTMLRPIRIAAGLGDPPSEFCTNDSEAMNSSIKQHLKFKKSDWPVFNDKIKAFISEQQEEVCKAIVGTGQYRLKKEYESLAVAQSAWFTQLNNEQRESAKKKFQETCVINLVPSTTNDPCAQGEDEESITTPDDISGQGLQQLSVDVETAAQYTGIPALVLRQIWAKALDVLNANQVMPAPGCSPYDHMVASTSKTRPHYVSATKDGRFECDDNCPNFVQRCICSHCVAAAESNNLLERFVKSYGEYAKTPKGQKAISPNFTRLSMTNLARQTAGRKRGKAPPKKTISRKKTLPYEQRQSRPSLAVAESQTGNSMQSSVASSLHSASDSSWNWPLQEQLSPFDTTNQPPYMSNHPPLYMPPYSGFTPFADLSYQYPPFGNTGETFGVHNFYSPQAYSTSEKRSEPFFIKMLNGRIKVCAGCKGPHLKSTGNKCLSPPHDICLGHKESMTYTNPRNGQECSKLGNVYYHINLECIRRKHPTFSSSEIVCSPDVLKTLTDLHFHFLQEAVGYTPS